MKIMNRHGQVISFEEAIRIISEHGEEWRQELMHSLKWGIAALENTLKYCDLEAGRREQYEKLLTEKREELRKAQEGIF